MKCNIQKTIMIASASAALGLMFSMPAMADVSGHLDWANQQTIAGWAWDDAAPDQALEVHIDITPDGSRVAASSLTVTAESYRGDLDTSISSGSHGFYCPVDWSRLDEGTFTVTAYVVSDGVKVPLDGVVPYDTAAKGLSLAVAAEDITLPVSASQGPGYGPGSANTSSVSVQETKADETEAEETADSASESGPAAAGAGAEDDEAEPVTVSGWKQGASLGIFSTTGYCNCPSCSKWGLTYSGTVPKANHTIAADLNVLPLWSKVMVNGIVYTVEDIGSGVKGNHIDIYYDTHDGALNHGWQYAEVFAVIEE